MRAHAAIARNACTSPSHVGLRELIATLTPNCGSPDGSRRVLGRWALVCYQCSMKTKLVIAACLACAAVSALAQTRLGSSAVGTMGNSGAVTDVGGAAYGALPLPSDPRTTGPIDPRTGAPDRAAAPASSAPATSGALEQAPASAARPVIDGAVWGNTPTPSERPAQ